MKKRKKKYVPREVRVPAYMFKVYPELTKEARDDIDVYAFVSLDALKRGEGSVYNAEVVQSAMCSCYILAAAFEHKADIQMTSLLGFACMNAVKKLIDDGQDLDPALFVAAEQGLNLLADMSRACDRETLVRATRAGLDAKKPVIAIARGAAWMIEPDWEEHDPHLKRLCNKRGATIINGKLRTGYMHRNKELKRIEWIDPVEETTVPVLENVVMLLAEPIKVKPNEIN